MPCALRISEAASMAMHATGLLALTPGKPLTTKAIAACFRVSEAHLSKVMQRLVKVGLVTSIRGPGGGFILAKEAESISLLEVFEAIEGPTEVSECLFGVPLCDGKTCVLGRVMADANQMLLDHLSETNLLEISKVFLDGRVTLPFPVKTGTGPGAGSG